MYSSKINHIIAEYIKNGGCEFSGHILLILILLVLTLGMLHNTEVGAVWLECVYEYSVFYEWLSYFSIFGGIIYLNLKVLLPRFLLKGKLTHYVCLIIICVLVALTLIIIMQNILFTLSNEDGGLTKPLLNITGNIISIGLVIISTSIYPLFRGWAEYSRQVSELETSTAEAELQQLKRQINPHFLFNTINNANIKAENDSEQAFCIISKLRDLLAYQLIDTNQDQVNLKDDISFLADYLALEKSRRSRFSYTLETTGNMDDVQISPLLFIPFVENAIKYSLTTKESSSVTIHLEVESGYLNFFCQNTKPATPVNYVSGGIGLKNIQRRLELLYGSNYTLNISESKETYEVNLHLKI